EMIMEDLGVIIVRVVILLAIAQASYAAPQEARGITTSQGSKLQRRNVTPAPYMGVRKRDMNTLFPTWFPTIAPMSMRFKSSDMPPNFVQNCNEIHNMDIGDSTVFFSKDGDYKRRCKYRFKSPSGTQIAVQCPQFQLGCKGEKIIFNQKNFKKLEFCGRRRPQGVVSNSNELLVVYFRKAARANKSSHFSCAAYVLGGQTTKSTTITTLTTAKSTTEPSTTRIPSITTKPTTTPSITTNPSSSIVTSTSESTSTMTSLSQMGNASSPTTSSDHPSGITQITEQNASPGWFYLEGENPGWYYGGWGQSSWEQFNPGWTSGESSVPPGWFYHSGNNSGWYWQGWGQQSTNNLNTIPTWNWNNPWLSTVQSSSTNQVSSDPRLSSSTLSSTLSTMNSGDGKTSWGYWAFVPGTAGKIKEGWSWVGTGTPAPTSPRN
ncbi:unnamed protein product, partial [Meganyctiphanes norvegica]